MCGLCGCGRSELYPWEASSPQIWIDEIELHMLGIWLTSAKIVSLSSSFVQMVERDPRQDFAIKSKDHAISHRIPFRSIHWPPSPEPIRMHASGKK